MYEVVEERGLGASRRAAPATARRVSVVGDFNGWDAFITPMKRRKDGTLRAKVKLARDQTLEFKYLTDDGTWFCDPDVESRTHPDGQVNSVVHID